MFKSKSLRELSVWGAIHRHASVSRDPSIFLDNSEISTLRFSLGTIHPKILALLIVSCKILESFSYDRSELGSGLDRGRKEVDFTLIEDTLNYLRSLSIYGIDVNLDIDEWTLFSSLANFEKLESLRDDAAVLFPSEDVGLKLSRGFPSSLKRLRLLETPRYICDNLDGRNSLLSDFIENTDTILPEMKYLAVGLPEERHGQEEIYKEVMSDYHTFQDAALWAEMEKRDCKCKFFWQEPSDEEEW